VSEEACPNNLAPTSSTTAQMVMGDALAVCLMQLNGFDSDDFAKFHPGGNLGKRLYLRVDDIYKMNQRPVVKQNFALKILFMKYRREGLVQPLYWMTQVKLQVSSPMEI
jgi:arabinose-5-phosphate isomerase